jgi:hypothetical protein
VLGVDCCPRVIPVPRDCWVVPLDCSFDVWIERWRSPVVLAFCWRSPVVPAFWDLPDVEPAPPGAEFPPLTLDCWSVLALSPRVWVALSSVMMNSSYRDGCARAHHAARAISPANGAATRVPKGATNGKRHGVNRRADQSALVLASSSAAARMPRSM